MLFRSEAHWSIHSVRGDLVIGSSLGLLVSCYQRHSGTASQIFTPCERGRSLAARGRKNRECHDKPLAPDRGPERKSGKLGDQCQKLIQRGFCVTVKHSCVFFKEERIFDAGIAGSLPPL